MSTNIDLQWTYTNDGRAMLKDAKANCLAVINHKVGVMRIKDTYMFMIAPMNGKKIQAGGLHSANMAEAQSEIMKMMEVI